MEGSPFPAEYRKVPCPAIFLKTPKTNTTCVVIGSGLAGLTCGQYRWPGPGSRVLLLEQHYKLGGMATWFKRPGGHIFDISLHGFPVRHGQKLPAVLDAGNCRFDRAAARTFGSTTRCSRCTTTFNRDDFTRLLIEQFDVSRRRPSNGFLRHGPRHEFLRRSVDDRPANCSSDSFPAATT